MTAPPDDTTTDVQAVIAALRAERDAALHTIDAPIIDVLLGSIQISCRAQHVRQPFCSLLDRGDVRRCHEMTPHPHQTVILPRENSEWLPAPHNS